MNKVKVIIFMLIVAVALGVWAAEVGGAPLVGLGNAPDLSGAISQSLVASSNGTLPQAGSDFQINDTHYMDNKTWAASKISLTDKSGNSINAVVVLRQIKNTYQVVLGPGTAFLADNTRSLPPDVIKYLRNAGVVIYSLPGAQP